MERLTNGQTERSGQPIPDESDASDIVGAYLHSAIRGSTLLSADEEHALARNIKLGKKARRKLASTAHLDESTKERLLVDIEEGDRARKRLVESNTQLVFSIAGQYQHPRMPFEDLVQEGNLGVMRAADKFDDKKGTKFSTYATAWIRHFVLRSFPYQSRNIKIPAHMSEFIRKVLKIKEELEISLQRDPTADEIAQALNVQTKKVKLALTTCADTTSLDRKIGEDKTLELIDLIPDKSQDPESKAINQTSKESLFKDLYKNLDTLDPRERKVLELRYGLEDGVERSFRKVGKIIGMSGQSIKLIENKAFAKLKTDELSRHLI